MSCASESSTFRLLDRWVGWDAASVEGLVGHTEAEVFEGVQLAPIGRGLTPEGIARALPPARLARGCDPCTWYLVTPCPPPSRLLRRSACSCGFERVSKKRCEATAVLRCAAAVAVATRGRIAVSDPGAGRLFLFDDDGSRLVATIPVEAPGPVAYTPWGEWLVVDSDAGVLRRFDPAGRERPPETPPLPGAVDRIGVDGSCRIWIVTERDSEYAIWVTARGEESWAPGSLSDLRAAFPDTGIVRVEDDFFCLAEGSDGMCCYSWHGRPVEPGDDAPSPSFGPASFETAGQLLTTALDSGIPRCRWHRVRIEANIPEGTRLEVSVSTHDEPEPQPKGAETDPIWQAFSPGRPHPSDWQTEARASSAGELDFLIDQPAGRYLFLRLRLSGDGRATPVVHRIRIDFPRRTSLDALPQVYRDNPAAEDFTERFLSLFDAAIEDIDRAIERNPALVDVMGVPDEVLPWLGTFLDVVMDPAWTGERRRLVLKAVPGLYRRRGTVSGLSETLSLLFDAEPVIQEIALERMWGGLGESALGAVRLFSPERTRFRVGRSPLSRAPLRSYGDPALDPLATHAFRFRVSLPSILDEAERERLSRVVTSQKPAHTVATVSGARQGLVLGAASARVGVDTALVPLPAPVLGHPNLLLGGTVLWHRRGASKRGVRVGSSAAVGINTVME